MKKWAWVITIFLMSKVTMAQVHELSLSSFMVRSVGPDTFFVWSVPPLGSLRSVEVILSSNSLGGYGDLFLIVDDKVQSSQGVDLAGTTRKSILLPNYERRFQKAEVWFLGKIKIEKILIDYNEVLEPSIGATFESVQRDTDHTRVLANRSQDGLATLDRFDPNMKVQAPPDVISQLLGGTSKSKGLSIREIIEFLKQDQQTNWTLDNNGKFKRVAGTSISLPRASHSNNQPSPDRSNPNLPGQSVKGNTQVDEKGSAEAKVQKKACIQSFCVGTRIQERGSNRQGYVIRVEIYSRRITVRFDDGDVVTYNL
jgi:hypothetical protein